MIDLELTKQLITTLRIAKAKNPMDKLLPIRIHFLELAIEKHNEKQGEDLVKTGEAIFNTKSEPLPF